MSQTSKKTKMCRSKLYWGGSAAPERFVMNYIMPILKVLAIPFVFLSILISAIICLPIILVKEFLKELK
jgi:hypothetical protein